MKKPSLSVFLLLAATFIFAQRPVRVGVVLSGGGAKGYAHVGVLKVIEEAGIRIDYVGGASMGAIVGGLYASGWSPEELDSMLHSIDLTAVLSEPVMRETQTFFEKNYGEKYTMTLSVDEGKISLPLAFSNGQLAYDMLSELTAHVATVHDFSQLPIPFFCTGTDVATGEGLIFDQGNLPLAMRASGAFPGLLAPVKIDGRLVADGGIVNNFPVREMKDRGVDIVIGINVEEDLLDVSALNSLEKILLQIGSYQLAENSSKQYPYADLLICPYTYGYSVTSFEAVDTLAQLGEQAARQVWHELLAIAEKQKQAGDLQHAMPERGAVTWQVDSVFSADGKMLTDERILNRFSAELPGRISDAQFRKGISNLYGSGNYRFIDYRLVENADGNVNLYLNPTTKPGRNTQVKVGLHFDDQYKSGLLLNFTRRDFLLENAVVSLDLILGDKFRYNLNYYSDFRKRQGFGLNSRLHLNDFGLRLPNEIMLPDSSFLDELVFDFTDFSNEVYAHLFSSKDYAIGLSSELKYYHINSSQVTGETEMEGILNDQGWYLGAAAFFKMDNRPKRYFSPSGILCELTARAVLPLAFLPGEEQETKPGYNLDAQFEATVPATERLTLGFAANVGFTLENKIAPYRYFFGGNNLNTVNNFRPFRGLHFAELAGTDLLMAKVYGQYRFLENHYLTLSASHAFLKQSFDQEDVNISSIAIGYGLDTVLGPVELTYGLSDRKDSFYLNLGYWF